MSKLVIFLFLGACVMAVPMQPQDEVTIDENIDDILDAMEPEIMAELGVDDRIRINWNKVWSKVKPIAKEAGKAAAGSIIKGALGK